MQVADGFRGIGYAIVLIVSLMALFGLCVGNAWAASAFVLTGALLTALIEGVIPAPSRSTTRDEFSGGRRR
ncbi:hypothetical protein [Limobrevibacterium gyesilva]|uniref:Uncharacterized protein n=1 Tax=Limobrevibacterium gyesilva TaxID=2991712 RepID=A0AA42CCE5_9PROT|nr:hypothetical protein [Limobrevibacterium gyesilva]MCW3473208.1 hypothetical protein [Limobrevibacterium gyesilva]